MQNGVGLNAHICSRNTQYMKPRQKIPVMIDLDWLWLIVIEVVFQ